MKCVLYAEDNSDDVTIMRLAFQRAEVGVPLQVVHDGQEAMSYLLGYQQYQDRARYPEPRVILLDLNLPKLSGFEVLQKIRLTPSIARTPVLMLTSSDLQADIEKSAALGADGYLVKPAKLTRLVEMAKAIHNYWLVDENVSTGAKRDAAGFEWETPFRTLR